MISTLGEVFGVLGNRPRSGAIKSLSHKSNVSSFTFLDDLGFFIVSPHQVRSYQSAYRGALYPTG